MAIPWTNYVPTVSDFVHHMTNTNLLMGDLCFVFLTLSNVFVMYRFLTDVLPYPLFVTWWQLAQGLVMAIILGEVGQEYSKLGYFPRVEVSKEMLWQLLFPTLTYVGMLSFTNIVLFKTQTIATYPVVLSFTVIVHHLARFIGCREEYFDLRWKSVGILGLGFLIGCLDENTVSPGVIPYVVAAAMTSAVFRAGFLQRIMHVVDGKGNILHNHQHFLGTIILLPLIFFCGEAGVWRHLPSDYTLLYSWQVIGCLVVIGFIPFAKNVVSNMLVRKTGQAPWRFLELVSICLVAFVGLTFFRTGPSNMGYAAVLLTVLGRAVGAIDILRNADTAAFMNRRPLHTDDHDRRCEKVNQTPLLESIREPSDESAF